MIEKHYLSTQEISEIKGKKKVCVYGAGKVAKGIAQRMLDTMDMKIDFFCDRDPQKWGQEIIPGIYCISPKELAQTKNCVCFLLIGQIFKESALNDLKKMSNIEWIMTYDDLLASDAIVDGILGNCRYNPQIMSDNSIDYKGDIYTASNKAGKRAVIYTCITGGYESVVQPAVIDDRFDYYCITDDPEDLSGVYQWISADSIISASLADNTRRNRFCKIMGARIFKEYDYSIYVDGNIRIIGGVQKYLEKMNEYGFLSHGHAFEDCIFSEAVRVIAKSGDDEALIKNQMAKYREEGMPRHYGMLHNAVLVRENNNPICVSLMDQWWEELTKFSKRDQLSLTYCMWKMGIKPSDIGLLGDNMRANPDFEWVSAHG